MDTHGSPSQSPIRPRRKRVAPQPRDTPALVTDRLGRYVVTGRLGRGGMGVVYEATDTLLERRVAIKLLPREVSSNPDALARFRREARGAARLNHANVVAVFDVGETDGTHYIVMELVPGENAQERMRARGPFPWAEATGILRDACRGAEAAHKAGLIHRDIKPANILLSADGGVKLGDFGLAKPTGIKGTEVTALGDMVGTPYFMSPEQGRCSPLDERTDIYSLGATYFALLTGRPPFTSPDCMQVIFAHCSSPVPDPRELAPDVPEACAAVVRKAMEKERGRRYAGAGALLADLERILEAAPPENRTPAPADGVPTIFDEPSGALSLADGYPGERSGPAPRPKGRPLLAVGNTVLAGVLAVGALVAFLATRRGDEVPGAPPETPPAARPEADDWPVRAAEAERAVRGRDPVALKRARDSIRVAEQRGRPDEPARADAVRQTAARVGKALAFRESITERGLVLGTDGWATSLVLSADDRWLAVGQSHGDAGALVFDSHTGEKRYTVWPRRGNVMVRVHALAFDRDGAVLAAATADTRVRVAHVASGKETTYDPGPGVKRVAAVAVSPATQTLVAGLEPYGEGRGKPYLKAWNLDTGKEPFAFKHEHLAQLGVVGFTAGGHQLVSGGHDKRLVMWNADTGRIWRELRCGVTIRAVACHPHGRTLVVAGTGPDGDVIQFWDYAAETLLATRPIPGGACRALAYTRDGAVLAAGAGPRVQLWNPEAVTLLTTLTGHNQEVLSAAFAAEGGVLVTGSADQTVRLWDVTRHLAPRPAR